MSIRPLHDTEQDSRRQLNVGEELEMELGKLETRTNGLRKRLADVNVPDGDTYDADSRNFNSGSVVPLVDFTGPRKKPVEEMRRMPSLLSENELLGLSQGEFHYTGKDEFDATRFVEGLKRSALSRRKKFIFSDSDVFGVCQVVTNLQRPDAFLAVSLLPDTASVPASVLQNKDAGVSEFGKCFDTTKGDQVVLKKRGLTLVRVTLWVIDSDTRCEREMASYIIENPVCAEASFGGFNKELRVIHEGSSGELYFLTSSDDAINFHIIDQNWSENGKGALPVKASESLPYDQHLNAPITTMSGSIKPSHSRYRAFQRFYAFMGGKVLLNLTETIVKVFVKDASGSHQEKTLPFKLVKEEGPERREVIQILDLTETELRTLELIDNSKDKKQCCIAVVITDVDSGEQAVIEVKTTKIDKLLLAANKGKLSMVYTAGQKFHVLHNRHHKEILTLEIDEGSKRAQDGTYMNCDILMQHGDQVEAVELNDVQAHSDIKKKQELRVNQINSSGMTLVTQYEVLIDMHLVDEMKDSALYGLKSNSGAYMIIQVVDDEWGARLNIHTKREERQKVAVRFSYPLLAVSVPRCRTMTVFNVLIEKQNRVDLILDQPFVKFSDPLNTHQDAKEESSFAYMVEGRDSTHMEVRNCHFNLLDALQPDGWAKLVNFLHECQPFTWKTELSEQIRAFYKLQTPGAGFVIQTDDAVHVTAGFDSSPWKQLNQRALAPLPAISQQEDIWFVEYDEDSYDLIRAEFEHGKWNYQVIYTAHNCQIKVLQNNYQPGQNDSVIILTSIGQLIRCEETNLEDRFRCVTFKTIEDLMPSLTLLPWNQYPTDGQLLLTDKWVDLSLDMDINCFTSRPVSLRTCDYQVSLKSQLLVEKSQSVTEDRLIVDSLPNLRSISMFTQKLLTVEQAVLVGRRTMLLKFEGETKTFVYDYERDLILTAQQFGDEEAFVINRMKTNIDKKFRDTTMIVGESRQDMDQSDYFKVVTFNEAMLEFRELVAVRKLGSYNPEEDYIGCHVELGIIFSNVDLEFAGNGGNSGRENYRILKLLLEEDGQTTRRQQCFLLPKVVIVVRYLQSGDILLYGLDLSKEIIPDQKLPLIGKLGTLLEKHVTVNLINKSWVPKQDFEINEYVGTELLAEHKDNACNGRAYYRDCLQLNIDSNSHVLILKSMTAIDGSKRYNMDNFQEIEVKQELKGFADPDMFVPLGVRLIDAESEDESPFSFLVNNRAESIGILHRRRFSTAFRLYTRRDVALLQIIPMLRTQQLHQISMAYFGTIFNGQPCLRILKDKSEVAGHLLNRMNKLLEQNAGSEDGQPIEMRRIFYSLQKPNLLIKGNEISFLKETLLMNKRDYNDRKDTLGQIAVLNDEFSLDHILYNQSHFIRLLNSQLPFLRVAMDKSMRESYCTAQADVANWGGEGDDRETLHLNSQVALLYYGLEPFVNDGGQSKKVAIGQLSLNWFFNGNGSYHTLVEMILHFKHDSHLVKTDMMQVLYKRFWPENSRMIQAFHFWPMLATALLYQHLAIMVAPSSRNGGVDHIITNMSSIKIQMYVLSVIVLYHIVTEVINLSRNILLSKRSMKLDVLDESKDAKYPWAAAFRTSFTNVLNLLQIALFVCSIIVFVLIEQIDTYGLKEVNLFWLYAALLLPTVLTWAQCILGLQVFDSMGIYPMLLIYCLNDSIKFFVYLFLLVGLLSAAVFEIQCTALYLGMDVQVVNFYEENMYTHWWSLSVNNFLYAAGNFDSSFFEMPMNPFFSQLLFIMFFVILIMTNITAFNILIAIVSDTFDRVYSDQLVICIKRQLFYTRQKGNFLNYVRFRHEYEPDVFVVSPVPTNEEDGDAWEGKVSMIKKFTERHKNSIEELTRESRKQILTMIEEDRLATRSEIQENQTAVRSYVETKITQIDHKLNTILKHLKK